MSQKVMQHVGKDDIVIHIGGKGSEGKLYKHDVDPKKVFFVDPLFEGQEDKNCFGLCISDREGNVPVFVPENGASWQNTSMFRSLAETDAPGIVVRSTTLDRFMEERGLDRIDLLICNSEGGEYRMLSEGAPKDWIGKTRMVAIDFHRGVMEENEEREAMDEAIALLERHYDIEREDRGNYVAVFGRRKE